MNTSSYLSKRGYVLRKEYLSNEEITHLKSDLRGRPLVDEKYNFFGARDTSFPLYVETQNKFYIPKMYGITRYGSPTSEVSNYIGKRWESPMEFRGTLYDYQVEPCEHLLGELQTGGGGILALPTGFGKSISAIYVLSQLRGKTLIIVNKITLMKQWEREIQTFLPGCRVGFIQGGKNVDVHDKDIVIAMLQSLAKIDYPQEIFNEFNVTLVDEIHNVSSPVFSKVLMKVCSKYTIGLSATPKRSDGCEYVFKWFIGDIVYEGKTERRGIPPVLHVVKVSSKEYKEVATVNRMTGGKQINYSGMLSELIQMSKRNEVIVDTVKKLVTKQDRRILLMSDRREHLKTIKQLMDNDVSITFTYGLFIGQMRIADLEQSKRCQVILATFQAFGEGVSERDLNTLMLITPKKFIGHLKTSTKNESGKLEQIVGRIFRKEHTQIPPLIIDFQDNFSVYKAQSRGRMAFYKQHFPKITIVNSSVDLEGDTDFDVTDTTVASNENDIEATNVYNQCLLE
jgi:superfamily II DNA or RNA helicase